MFCNRKRDVAILEKSFERHKLSGGALHGDMNQHARLETLQKFRDGEIIYLLASDVAARGLDVPEVSHVINFDIPDQPEDYIHRIGRTGRAGMQGNSISLVTPRDKPKVAAIEKLISTKLPWLGSEPSADDEAPVRASRGRGRKRETAKKADGPRPARDNETKVDKPNQERKPAEEKAVSPVEPVHRAETEKKRAPRKQSNDTRKPRSEGRVTGLGDHVPAFLMKTVRSKD